MIRWKSCALLAGLLPGGCLPVPGRAVVLDGQDEAVRIIWEEGLGRADRAPQIHWVFADEHNCTPPRSERRGFKTFLGCVEGLTLAPSLITVAWTDGGTFSDTTLAHELIHAAQLRHLIFDFKHQGAAFKPGGALEQSNALLLDAGL